MARQAEVKVQEVRLTMRLVKMMVVVVLQIRCLKGLVVMMHHWFQAVSVEHQLVATTAAAPQTAADLSPITADPQVEDLALVDPLTKDLMAADCQTVDPLTEDSTAVDPLMDLAVMALLTVDQPTAKLMSEIISQAMAPQVSVALPREDSVADPIPEVMSHKASRKLLICRADQAAAMLCTDQS